MTQDERWNLRYQEVMDFIETNHRNPSKHRIEKHDINSICTLKILFSSFLGQAKRHSRALLTSEEKEAKKWCELQRAGSKRAGN